MVDIGKKGIEIKEINNGWLLTIECDNMVDAIAVKEKYFETFPEVLAHLHELNIK